MDVTVARSELCFPFSGVIESPHMCGIKPGPCRHPSTGHNHPSTGLDHPSTGHDQPSTGNYQPSTAPHSQKRRGDSLTALIKKNKCERTMKLMSVSCNRMMKSLNYCRTSQNKIKLHATTMRQSFFL